MPTYRVYYATEEHKREYRKETFIVLAATNRIDALRKAFDYTPEAIKFGAISEAWDEDQSLDEFLEDIPILTEPCRLCDGLGNIQFYNVDLKHEDIKCCPECSGNGYLELDIPAQPVHNQVNPTPSATQKHVQVQWWLSGARQGAYSQETYSVIESDNKWTAFHDALGRKHVVATDRVRFVASRKEQKAQVAA